ncbi:MAG: Crp/Fnr family transcriptional regulator [Pseudomonadota bacterium]
MTATHALAEPTNSVTKADIAIAAPFSELQAPVLEAVAEIADRRAYEKGETIFSLGQFDGSEFYIIEDGTLSVSRLDEETGAMLFDQYRKGDVFALPFAVAEIEDSEFERLTLLADRRLTVIGVDADAFRHLVGQRPSLTKALMAHFAKTLATSQGQRIEQDASPERRVFARLLEIVQRDPVDGLWKIERMPKHRELADAAEVGETVAAQSIAQIIQDGLARREYPGLIISNMDGLQRLAE